MFEEYYQKYLKLSNQIPEQQQQKLNFLIFSIKHNDNDQIEINPANYPDLDVEEIEGLFQLPVEAQKSMFCSVFKSLELEDDSKIEGELHVKGETLGIWRIKKLELNLTTKKLKVPRKEGSVDLQLQSYGIMWIGQKKAKSTYYCFILIAHNQAIYDHYKQLILGSDDEEYAKKWYNLICGVCNPKPLQQRRMSGEYQQLSIASPPLNKSDQLDLSKSDNYSESWLNQKQIYTPNSLIKNGQMQQINEQPESPDQKKQKIQIPSQIIQTKDQVNENKEQKLNNFPQYLNDLNYDIFQQGEFYRCGNNVYKSVSKQGLYQIQVQIDQSIETIIYFLYQGLGFNKYIINEWCMFDYNNYKVVEQTRKNYYFGLNCNQNLFLLRYKSNDSVIEKQLNSSNPLYSIAKLFKRETTVLQVICQLNEGIFQEKQCINFMEQYNQLKDHIHYISTFRDLYFEQVNVLNTSSSFSHNSEEMYTEKFVQLEEEQKEKIPNNLFDLLEFVQNNNHWRVALNRIAPSQPFQVEPKLQKSTPQCHFLLKNYWKVDYNQGGLLYVDEIGLSEQKKVFSYILTQIGSSLLQAKSLTNISLPVYVFEKQSNLQRYAKSLTYLQYLDEAVNKDPLTQLKNFLPYGYGTVILYLNMWKPFNPILGETYQGYINGCPIYAEQVSHHPPISNLMIYGRGYKVNQSLCTLAKISANSVTGINQGYTKVYFEQTNSEFIFLPCAGTYNGTIYGDKIFQMTGKFHVLNLKEKLVIEITLNPYPGSLWKKRREHLDDYFEGYIYQVSDECVQRFKKEGHIKFKELRTNEMLKQLSKITGIWHKEMFIDNVEVWNINKEPYVLEDQEFPLASDSNFREDLLSWKTNNFDLAMKMKTKLEELQRKDARNRKKK